ncbi:MAG: hypothetical protein BRC46_16235 [Cyanobacteria bacterium QS_6_48_18]|nr:MAG: hypothetical protein BRC43_07790 [Cyanobacteria bacterium QS_3_48_167]PSO89340.1 MAG: hypothetical protein BRC46_16235 [Cyanobacteria bacterium QS_6_48_18]
MTNHRVGASRRFARRRRTDGAYKVCPQVAHTAPPHGGEVIEGATALSSWRGDLASRHLRFPRPFMNPVATRVLVFRKILGKLVSAASTENTEKKDTPEERGKGETPAV